MGKKILIIDDEVDFTELTSTLLRFNDFDVDTINEPTEVREKLQNESYELVVSDLMMPNLSGFDLIEQIRDMQDYREKPIIVLSAKILNDEERKFLLQKNVEFLTKPFEPQSLVSKILQTLSRDS